MRNHAKPASYRLRRRHRDPGRHRRFQHHSGDEQQPHSSASGSGATTIHTATATVGGQSESILVDAKGDPLYIYKPDTATTSRVTGQLAALWPPVVSTTPTISGAKGTVTTVATPNGNQVSYNGHFSTHSLMTHPAT